MFIIPFNDRYVLIYSVCDSDNDVHFSDDALFCGSSTSLLTTSRLSSLDNQIVLLFGSYVVNAWKLFAKRLMGVGFLSHILLRPNHCSDVLRFGFYLDRWYVFNIVAMYDKLNTRFHSFKSLQRFLESRQSLHN